MYADTSKVMKNVVVQESQTFPMEIAFGQWTGTTSEMLLFFIAIIKIKIKLMTRLAITTNAANGKDFCSRYNGYSWPVQICCIRNKIV